MMLDLKRQSEIVPGVHAFDFSGPRISAINNAIILEVKTEFPTLDSSHGENILKKRANNCVFDQEPLPGGLAALKKNLYYAFNIYRKRSLPEFANSAFSHRSWCNHYKPNEGVPWHDHFGTPVVAVYYVKGEGGDLIVLNDDDDTLCHRIETPPGRLIFMSGERRHCSSPNFGPHNSRISLPVNFYFEPSKNSDEVNHARDPE